MARWEIEEDEPGCAYILDDCGVGRACGAPRRPSSPYCSTHHLLCHVAYGSPAEADHLRQWKRSQPPSAAAAAAKGAGLPDAS
jgi:hypothetical protein